MPVIIPVTVYLLICSYFDQELASTCAFHRSCLISLSDISLPFGNLIWISILYVWFLIHAYLIYDSCTFTIFFINISKYLYFVKCYFIGKKCCSFYNILQYTCTTHIFNKLCKTVSADQDVYNDLLKNEKENFKVLYQKVKTFIYGLIFWPKPL